MNILEAIEKRRSIRKYKSTPVTKEQVETLLHAAMLAPSAGNAQPWEFIIIESEEGKKTVSDFNPYAGMAKNAPLSILICGNLKEEKFAGFWPQDCSAAVQNIMLAALEMGLGTVWTGIYPIEDRIANYSKAFNLPEHIIPFACIVVGTPDQANGKVNRYNPAKVHYEKF